jgi:SAM-dependent methyltransferase
VKEDKFIDISFRTHNLDIYQIRKTIFRVLNDNLKFFKGSLLDVGCGQMPYRDHIKNNSGITKYVGLDIDGALIYDQNVKPDFVWDGLRMPFGNSNFETIIATEVLEHCPEPETVLKEIHRVLKPDGIFFFTVPFLWNLHETPHDEYRYTPYSLKRHLENSGFKNIEIKPTGGWHASMAQMLGLWVRRSPMKENKRKFLSRILKPVIKKLISLDRGNNTPVMDGQMITGLYGTAKK